VTGSVLRKYVLDTNLFVDGFRDARANAALQRFHLLFAPFEYLSAVVSQELLAGASSSADRRTSSSGTCWASTPVVGVS
jgi:predicted nucleic acid-binding protein